MIDQEWFGMNGAHHRGHRVTQITQIITDLSISQFVLIRAICGESSSLVIKLRETP